VITDFTNFNLAIAVHASHVSAVNCGSCCTL